MGTKIHGRQVRVLVDEYDWSCLLNSANIASMRDLVDATTFVDPDDPHGAEVGGKEYLSGLVGSRVSTKGVGIVADPNTLVHRPWTTYDSTIFAKLGIHTSNAKGALAHEFQARIQSQPREFPVAGAVALSSEWQSEDQVYGKAVSGGESLTATGSLVGEKLEGPDADNEIKIGRTIVTTFRLVKVAGAGSFAGKLQSSADSTNGTDGTWADVTSHVSGTLTAIGVVRVASVVAGADLGPWFRFNVTTFATFTSVICRVSTGILLT